MLDYKQTAVPKRPNEGGLTDIAGARRGAPIMLPFAHKNIGDLRIYNQLFHFLF